MLFKLLIELQLDKVTTFYQMHHSVSFPSDVDIHQSYIIALGLKKLKHVPAFLWLCLTHTHTHTHTHPHTHTHTHTHTHIYIYELTFIGDRGKNVDN